MIANLGRNGFLDTWTWMASTFGFLAIIQQFIPREYTHGIRRRFKLWLQHLLPYVYCDIHEFGNSMSRNTLYQDVEVYINSLRVQGAQRLTLSKIKGSGSKEMTFALANDQRTLDIFERAEMEWVHHVEDRSRPMYGGSFFSPSDEKRRYTLRVNKKDKERLLDSYMKHIETKAAELKLAARDLQLYTNLQSRGGYFESRSSPWQSVPFVHPATFDTLALDGDLKSRISKDLDLFAANEEFYKRVGKAWKRGYLLYGPPGTGKSSMIAAIANKMRYDVYDLELTEVGTNADLRKLLLKTSNKSVIVIEDIDCSLDLSGQRKKIKKKPPPPAETPPGPPGQKPKEEQRVTLSGLLNFVDGLWSCCGSERIFIFTTNFKEKLDPALLRAGRMDMHVCLSYCTFSAFKTLAKNYLQITEHELFEKVESAFDGSFMTPADVTEEIIKNLMEDIDVALEKLIVALGEHRVDPSTLKSLGDEDEEEEAAESKEEKAESKEEKAESKEEKAESKNKSNKGKREKDSRSSPESKNKSSKGKREKESRSSPTEVEEKQPVAVTSSAESGNTGVEEIKSEEEYMAKELSSVDDSDSEEASESKEIADEKNSYCSNCYKEKRKKDSRSSPTEVEEKQPGAVITSAESGKTEFEPGIKSEKANEAKELSSIDDSKAQSQRDEDVKEISAVSTAKQESSAETQSGDLTAA